MKYIAVCGDIIELQGNRIFDKDWAKNFPGALWVSSLAELAKKKGLSVVTGDIALSNVRCGYWNAKDIFVIQELDAYHGRELISLGAKPAVLTGFESPMYAYFFYDELSRIAPLFQNRVLFSGGFRIFNALSGFNHQLSYPAFNPDYIQPIVPWDEREFLAMVIANKYWKERFRIPFFRNPRHYMAWMLAERRKRKSPTRRLIPKDRLHDKRLEAIEFFGKSKRIALFGKNWNELHVLPLQWQKRLKTILQNINPKSIPSDNKIKIMSNYKFAVCFENISYPGYITEKIIDCFAAGTIPIYLGAPDVQDFIPREAFIDMRKFGSWEGLDNYLNEVTHEDALKMISMGREFLQSKRGILHSFEGFAQFIMGITLE